MNILITGKPGSGKTTLIKKLAGEITAPKNGFYTEEIREGGRRTGFSLETFSGRKGILASVHIKSPFRVGKYGVDLEAFEKIGVTAIKEAIENKGIIIIDEIGKMELFSDEFKKAVERALNTKRVVATIKAGRSDFAGKVKKRDDVRVVAVTPANRNNLASDILKEIEKGK